MSRVFAASLDQKRVRFLKWNPNRIHDYEELKSKKELHVQYEKEWPEQFKILWNEFLDGTISEIQFQEKFQKLVRKAIRHFKEVPTNDLLKQLFRNIRIERMSVQKLVKQHTRTIEEMILYCLEFIESNKSKNGWK